nr:MAG TPA: hypothetical protein [Caudoviricetes sp.]
MLRLVGKSYIVQHIMNTRRQEAIALSYRAYMTDTLAGLAGVEERWTDRVAGIIDPRPLGPQQSAEEVIQRIKNGLNGGEET